MLLNNIFSEVLSYFKSLIILRSKRFVGGVGICFLKNVTASESDSQDHHTEAGRGRIPGGTTGGICRRLQLNPPPHGVIDQRSLLSEQGVSKICYILSNKCKTAINLMPLTELL